MQKIEQLLDNDRIQKQLLNASLFLLAYELLNSSIVDGVKEFFCDGFDESGHHYSNEYKTKVLPKAKHVFEASLIFLVEIGAISEIEKTQIQGIREYRNKIAHEIPQAIFNIDKQVDPAKLELAGDFLHKIDNFWGRIEADINPYFADREIDYDGITSLRSMAYNHIVSVVKNRI